MAALVISCTFCDPPVLAAKTCLHCEASLCEDHLRVHSKSQEHVLIDPTWSLEGRRCSIHNQTFSYYCAEDALCLCTTCCLAKEHRGHQLETIVESSKKLRQGLWQVFSKLSSVKNERDKDMRNLTDNNSILQNKLHRITHELTTLFKDIRTQLDLLEGKVLSEISESVEKKAQPISALIQQLEIMKEELATKMHRLEGLCSTADPLTVLQEGKAYIADSSVLDVDSNTIIASHFQKIQSVGELDEGIISVKLFKGLSDILEDIKRKSCGESDLLLDLSTASEFMDISWDLKMAKSSEKKTNRPKITERFQYSQVMSIRGFSSGLHYWEVECSDSGEWRCGVCYPSIDRRGESSYIGHNCKSWCLRGCNRLYSVIHNKRASHLYHTSATTGKLGIYLDYEAGRLSFYELSDPVRHLHTFIATFTEPLHAVFGMWNSSLRILL